MHQLLFPEGIVIELLDMLLFGTLFEGEAAEVPATAASCVVTFDAGRRRERAVIASEVVVHA